MAEGKEQWTSLGNPAPPNPQRNQEHLSLFLWINSTELRESSVECLGEVLRR